MGKRPDLLTLLSLAIIALAVASIVIVAMSTKADAAADPHPSAAFEWEPEVRINEEHRYDFLISTNGAGQGTGFVIDDRGNFGFFSEVETMLWNPRNPPRGISRRCRDSARAMVQLDPRVTAIACLENSAIADRLFRHEEPATLEAPP